jgi:pimeloyl-ACP methyl ester carboxylesterase
MANSRVTAGVALAAALVCGRLDAAPSHVGAWIGGVWGTTDTFFVKVTLGGEGAAAAGRIDFPVRNEWSILLEAVKVSGDRVSFEVPTAGSNLRFDGSLDGDRLTGQVRQNGGSASFELTRATIGDDPDFSQLEGDYEFEPGAVLMIYRSPLGPTYVDYRTGRTGLLYRLADGRYVAGPTLLSGFPIDATIRFERAEQGRAVALSFEAKGETKRATRRELYRREDVDVRNGDVALAGTLLLPFGPGPHPAVVMIHGSGPATREVFMPVADMLARNGFAVVVHDKRGTGRSTGSYHRADFHDLAGDAASLVEWLSSHDEIDPFRIGLHGSSLGAWVAPLAALRAPQVAFVIVEAAPATNPAEHERERVERQMRADGRSRESIAKAISFMDRKFKVARTGKGWDGLVKLSEQGQREGWARYINAPSSLENLRWNWDHIFSYDPRPALEALRCPVLAIYGSRDTVVAPALHLARMRDALARSAARHATVRELPGANHHFYAANTGGPDEISGLQGFADGYFDTRLNWLRQYVGASSPSAFGGGSLP